MRHCQKLGGRAPSVLSKEDWTSLQGLLDDKIYSKGKSKFFFLLTRYQKQNIWHWGDPSDQQHCTLAHTITAPPLFEVYKGI